MSLAKAPQRPNQHVSTTSDRQFDSLENPHGRGFDLGEIACLILVTALTASLGNLVLAGIETHGTLRNSGVTINADLNANGLPGQMNNGAGGAGCASAGEEPAGAGGANPALLKVGGFSSTHVGGCQFAMGDGSIKFISENVNMQTLKGSLTERMEICPVSFSRR